MRAFAMRSFKGLFTVALAGCVSVVLVGCAAESGEKVADGASKTTAKPADNTKMATLVPAERVSKEPAAERPAAKKPPVRATAVKKAQPPVVQKAQQPEPAPRSTSQDELRRETTDAIYAAIRVAMEKSLLKRKELLDGGRDPADVEIGDLERQIMKARGYLIEAGEEVEDVDPPLRTKS